MTIDQGPDTARYQGIVALEGNDLECAAHEYFLRSEQIPTRLRLAVAQELRAGGAGARWRAGGFLLQFLPQSPERARRRDLHPGDVPEGIELDEPPEDHAWVEARSLVETVEDVDLLDPQVSAEQLLYRLFHARGVRVFRVRDLRAKCSCSREGVERMLRSFPQDDRNDMVENGKITVTCEFCNATYVFEPMEVSDTERI
jgi:molecular chaperone Hsp33